MSYAEMGSWSNLWKLAGKIKITSGVLMASPVIRLKRRRTGARISRGGLGFPAPGESASTTGSWKWLYLKGRCLGQIRLVSRNSGDVLQITRV